VRAKAPRALVIALKLMLIMIVPLSLVLRRPRLCRFALTCCVIYNYITSSETKPYPKNISGAFKVCGCNSCVGGNHGT